MTDRPGPSNIDQIIENEREWRRYSLQKMDTIFNKIESLEHKFEKETAKIDRDLQSFKLRTALVIMSGSSLTGSGVTWFLNHFNVI